MVEIGLSLKASIARIYVWLAVNDEPGPKTGGSWDDIGAALAILAEIGPNLATFPDEHHFVSWLHLAGDDCQRRTRTSWRPGRGA